MRNFDEATITDAVLQRVKAANDDRVRQVSEALVRHLHAFVREIEPTQAEWEAGIDFLTRTGQMCDDKRQEFILKTLAAWAKRNRPVIEAARAQFEAAKAQAD